MRVYWELEGVGKKDNVPIKTGTKAQCKKVFDKLTEEQKAEYEFIYLQPYSESERLDSEELLYRKEI